MATEATSNERCLPRLLQGIVVRTSMNKTVVIEVETRKTHSLYSKTIRRRKRYLVHDEKAECGVGDLVEMMHTRPLSKLKRWRVNRIVQKAV